MIRLRIKQLMIQKGIKPTVSRLMKLGIAQNAAAHLLSDKVKSIKFKDLLNLCYNLNCTPREIFEINIPENTIHAKHPLWEWASVSIPFPLDDIQDLAPKHMQAVHDFVMALKQNDSIE